MGTTRKKNAALSKLATTIVLVAIACATIWCESQLEQRPDEPGPTEPVPSPPFDPGPPHGNETITSFSTAKRELGEIHNEGQHEITFYCGCRYMDKSVDLRSCGYRVRRNPTRAKRIEYEHVVPAARYGHAFSEWTEGHADCKDSHGEPFKGRDCARRASPTFALMEADMYNLQPAIGEVNGDRLNYEVGEIEGEAREYGACDVEIADQRVEPAPAIRGDVARTYRYMAWAYPQHMTLTPREIALFEQWDRADPVDEWERDRAKRIEAVQGNHNPFVR